MNADVIVDNELEPRETYAVVRKSGHGKRVIRVAHIHHDLRLRALRVRDLVLPDLEVYFAVIDVPDIAFGTRNSDVITVPDLFGRITCTNDARNPELAANDRAMTRATAALGNDRRCALHDRLPGRVRHRRDQYLAFFKTCELGRVEHYVRPSVPDPFTNGDAACKRSSVAAGQIVRFD